MAAKNSYQFTWDWWRSKGSFTRGLEASFNGQVLDGQGLRGRSILLVLHGEEDDLAFGSSWESHGNILHVFWLTNDFLGLL
jgi:hypothetical protein